MKKSLWIWGIAFLFLLMGCSAPASEPLQNAASPLPIGEEDGRIIRSGQFDRAVTWDTAPELNGEADFVVTGECLSTRVFYQDQVLYTDSEVRVKESFAGALVPGTIIHVVEMGGMTTQGEYKKECGIEEKDFEKGGEPIADDTPLLMGWDGYFPIEKGQSLLLFLGKDVGGFYREFAETPYYIVGGYDGKLLQQGSAETYARPLPWEGGKSARAAFSEQSLRITLDEIRQMNE